MEEVRRPTQKIQRHDLFQPTEVGLTHQFTNAYVRLNDEGDVEICAGEGIAIILHPHNRSITIMADKVKFITKETGGIIWNRKTLNDKATKFTEPALIDYEPSDGVGMFRGFDDFIED